MSDFPMGLSLTETDSAFVLTRKMHDGNVVTIPLSLEEMAGLKAEIDRWVDRALTRTQEKSGSLRAIVVHPVAGVEISTDALRSNILLMLASPTGERMTFEIPPIIGQYIADELPSTLHDIDEPGNRDLRQT